MSDACERPEDEDPIAHPTREDTRAEGAPFRRTLGTWIGAGAPARAGWRAYAGSALIVAACTVIALPMQPHFEITNLTMVYLLGVVVAAIMFGRGPSIAAAVLSVAVFNFIFVPPRFTFEVADTRYLFTFAVMLVVAAIVGTLTGWLREQFEAARLRERRTAALYRLSHDVAAQSTASGVVSAAVDRIAEVLHARVAAMLPDADGVLNLAAGDAEIISDPGEQLIARQSYHNGQLLGLGLERSTSARCLHIPLEAGPNVRGVLAVQPRDPSEFRDPARLQLLRALASQTALALERCVLSEEAQRARTQAETERSRSALLSSVSHDLRTPLAAITGAASSLRDDAGSLSEDTKRELADTISEEAQRLNRLIGSLLDMTRLESGALHVRKEWHSIEELVGAALARLERQLGDRVVILELADDLPLVPLDDMLFEQVIWNLVENANKYATAGQAIEVTARIDEDAVRIEVADRGPGLHPGEAERVFQKFFRGTNASGRPGVGLGLAICRGIVEAHGGTIEAVNRQGGGARFTVRLPLGGVPPVVEHEALPKEAP